MGKADSRHKEEVESMQVLWYCGKSIGSYSSQLALSCNARLWLHKAGSKIKHMSSQVRKDRMKNML